MSIIAQIGDDTIIHDSLAKIYDYLEANLTDPEAGSRDPKTPFLSITWPESRQHYPHVIIAQGGGSGRRAGSNSLMFITPLIFTIMILTKNEEQCDTLSDQVLAKMRAGIPTFVAYGMNFMRMLAGPRAVPMVTDPRVHRKDIQYQFTIFVG